MLARFTCSKLGETPKISNRFFLTLENILDFFMLFESRLKKQRKEQTNSKHKRRSSFSETQAKKWPKNETKKTTNKNFFYVPETNHWPRV